MKSFHLIFSYFFISFIIINKVYSTNTITPLISSKIIKNEYPHLIKNCTYSYLLEIPSGSISNITSIICNYNTFHTPSYQTIGKNLNGDYSILFSDISLPIGSQQFKVIIIDSEVISNEITIQLESPCSELPSLVSPINKNPSANKWIMTKSRLLNQIPTLAVYLSNLNGFIYPTNNNNPQINSLLITSNGFIQMDKNTFLFNYYYLSFLGKTDDIKWLYFNNSIISDSIMFKSPVSENFGKSMISVSSYPQAIDCKNFKVCYLVINSTIAFVPLLGFIEDSTGTRDAMNIYPLYGSPNNSKHIAYFNFNDDNKNVYSEYFVMGYSSYESVQKYRASRNITSLVPPAISNVKSIQISYAHYDPYSLTIAYFDNDNQSQVTSLAFGPFIQYDRVTYPFGFLKGNSKNYSYAIGMVLPIYSDLRSYSFIPPSGITIKMVSSVYTGEISTPIISLVSFIPKVGDGLKTILRITASDKVFGLFYMETQPSGIKIIGSDLVDGNKFNGTYEKLIDFSIYPPITSITAYNLYNAESITFTMNNHQYPSNIPSISDITLFKFKKQTVDLSTDSFINTIYMNYSNANINYRPGFKLITTSEIARDFQWYRNYDYLEWDETLQLFKLDFYMPPRLFTGILEYRFNFAYVDLDPNSLSNLLVDNSINDNNAILSVTCDFADEMPPIVTKIKSSAQSFDLLWDITFSDDINGIESINVTISSEFDLVGETFTFFPSLDDNNKLVTVRINKTIYPYSKSQTYRISEIATRDTSGHYANSTFEPSFQNILNPWRLTYDDISNFDFTISNELNIEDNVPIINSVLLSTNSIDISTANRELTVTFSVSDDTGFSNNNPIVYFQTRMLETISVVANKTNCSSVTTCNYRVDLQFPFLFGYPEPILCSIYRIEDVFFNFNSYNYHKNTLIHTSNSVLETKPIIESTSSITRNGGDLILNGHWFGIDENAITIMIRYLDLPNENITSSSFIYQFGSEIKFKKIKANNGDSVYIRLKVGNQLSNEFKVVPIPLNNCPNNCNQDKGQGVCQSDGSCKCSDSKWFGVDCSKQFHYISSVLPSTTSGGEASFIGLFSDSHDNISISIGGLDCPILLNTSSLIKCNASAGIGIKNVTLTQNGYTFTALDIYKYIEISTSLQCPNKCSNNGICNSTTGICNCKIGFGLYDCSALINLDNGNGGGTNTTIDTGSSSTNFTNSETNFQISIKSLIEVDINNNVIKSYSLLKNWSFNKTDNEFEPNKYILKQILNSNNSSESESESNDKSFIITSIIEEIKDKNGKEFIFAGSSFIVPSGSIKFTISILNYTYQSNLNSLKLELISLTDNNNKRTDCNSKSIEIDTSNTNNLSTFNYIRISRNNKILEGRFINKVMSDGRSTFLTSTTRNDSNSIITTLNLPHCVSECIIDPDFSILISNDFKSSCEDNSRKWFLPVVITVPILGCFLLFVLGAIIYKKSTSVKVFVHGTKLKKINAF
ncbi:hypothetical protein ACTFIT_002711 [Dictyostelium discoideum]